MGLRTFTFAGTASSTYNLFIKEAAPYNAPERSVEMISIPGRNGAYALDHGRFENIEVTYKVCVYDEDHTDFAGEISDVRNWLCSKVGYQRLTDDYNPSEYRMAVYKSGLESDKVFLNGAEFDITFECKPQRWLTSGETATAVASGGKVTNPTLFPSHPMLQVSGYGSIDMGGQGITVNNEPIGQTPVYGGGTKGNFSLDLSALNTGDNFTISGATKLITYRGANSISATISATANCTATATASSRNLTISVTVSDKTFTKGTNGSQTSTVTYSVVNGGTTTSVTSTILLEYVSSTGRIEFGATHSTTVTNTERSQSNTIPQQFGISTKPVLGNPLYIDLDIGEAYKYESSVPVSVNNGVVIPAELPTLPSGDTTITYDNTFTQVKVLPRWWKV